MTNKLTAIIEQHEEFVTESEGLLDECISLSIKSIDSNALQDFETLIATFSATLYGMEALKVSFDHLRKVRPINGVEVIASKSGIVVFERYGIISPAQAADAMLHAVVQGYGRIQ